MTFEVFPVDRHVLCVNRKTRVNLNDTMSGSTVPDRLKVVQILPAMECGGTERGVLEIADALVQGGHQSLVISRGGRMVDDLLRHGSQHIPCDIGVKSPRVIRQITWLRRFLESESPDVIDVHSRLPAWVTLIAWRLLPVRSRPGLITTVHGFNTPGLYSSVMLQGERVIVVSESVRDYVGRHYPKIPSDRMHIVPRGIDSREFPRGFKPSKEWERTFHEQFPGVVGRSLVTIVGRLTRLKGHLEFPELIGELRKRGLSDVHGLIVGAADARKQRYEREIRQRVQALGLDEHVTFTAHRSDLKEIYASSSVVLSLSSTPESFGRTTAEALSIGVPVVGYDHGGVGEILRLQYADGLVEPGNLRQLADTVASVIGKRGQVVVGANQFEKATMQQRTLELYRQLAVAVRIRDRDSGADK